MRKHQSYVDISLSELITVDMAQLIMNKARKAQVADNDAPLSGRGAPDNSSR